MSVPGDWRVERNSLNIFTTDSALAGLQYTVTSRDINPSPQQLRRAPAPPANVGGYLTVPSAFEQLLPLTKRITDGHSGAYSKAVALQEWFTQSGGFTYSLDVPPPSGASGLVDFVTKTKRGYCQQFAFAMAVMARLAGIPSRVVVGYTQGVYRGNGVWEVRTSDAHAWPELYFAGMGWLRFEPTPSGGAGQAGQATATPPAYSFPPAGSVGPTPTPTRSAPTPGITPSAAAAKGGAGGKLKPVSAGGGRIGRGPSAPFPVWPVILAVLAVAAITPWAARSLIRHRRWRRAADDAGRAGAAWLELCDDLADHRVAYRASESPRALAHRLGPSLGFSTAGREALERIARAEERARYSPAPVPSAQLRGDVATVRREMAKACGLPGRCAAVVLPASVLVPARTALTHVLDVFGWMDVATTSLQHRAAGRRPSTTHS
jgi:hypothetical protein